MGELENRVASLEQKVEKLEAEMQNVPRLKKVDELSERLLESAFKGLEEPAPEQ